MKKSVFSSFLLLLFATNVFCQISWQMDFEQAKKTALKTGKSILIECFHPDCSHCQVLNQNLKNPELSKYLNDNYTNMKIDLTNQSQVKFLEERNIRLINYPVFLFFDDGGKLQYFLEPKETVEEIIVQFEEERGNNCLECEKRVNATLNENVKCAIFYRLLKDQDKGNAINNKIFESLEESEKASLGSWNIFKKVVFSPNNIFFQFWIKNHVQAASLEGNSNKEKDAFASIIQMHAKFLENKDVYPKWELDSLHAYLAKLGADEKRRLSWLWGLELNYYLNSKDYNSAKNLCRKMTFIYPDANTYSFLSEKINAKVEGVEMYDYFLEIKDKWLAGLRDPKHKSAYFVQAAQYYNKSGQKIECVNSLNQATQFGLSISDKNTFIQKYCK